MLFTDELLNRLNEKLATKDAPIAEFEAEVDRLAARKEETGQERDEARIEVERLRKLLKEQGLGDLLV